MPPSLSMLTWPFLSAHGEKCGERKGIEGWRERGRQSWEGKEKEEEGEKKLLFSSSYKTSNSLIRAPPIWLHLTLMTFYLLCLHIQLHWGTGLNIWALKGDTIQSYQMATTCHLMGTEAICKPHSSLSALTWPYFMTLLPEYDIADVIWLRNFLKIHLPT